MEMAFSKVLPAFTENVAELSNIADKMSSNIEKNDTSKNK